MSYKLTLDVGLMNATEEIPGMNLLKKWHQEGKIELVEADRPSQPKTPNVGWPGAKPQPSTDSSSPWKGQKRRSQKPNESGNANFRSVSAVLFPTKDPLKLSMHEINSVAHLIRHHSVKHEIFVTKNNADFLDGGRRARLESAFGIIALTPEETVQVLGEREGWLGGPKPAPKAPPAQPKPQPVAVSAPKPEKAKGPATKKPAAGPAKKKAPAKRARR